MPERFHFDVDGERLLAVVYAAVKPIGATLLLSHGESAGQEDRFIVEVATALAKRGVLVVTYDFPFIEHGRRAPDRNDVLEACCRAAIVAARDCRPRNRLFIGGKSLGGRVASEVAAAGGPDVADVAGVVVLGYPLHPPAKSAKSKVRHLSDLSMPVLFVQGTRDVFGTAEQLRRYLDDLPRDSEVRAVEGGNHSFVVPKRSSLSQDEVDASIQDDIARWIAQVSAAPTTKARAPSRAQRTPPARRTRTAAKASYAREAPSKSGRASRKSTRSSANRARSDTNLILREERAIASPDSRFRRARARATRVRGSPRA